MATIITTAAGLAAINGSSGSFELGADILDWNLPPIETFYGDLDGKGYTITGTIQTYTLGTYNKYAGLFYRCYGNVHDIVFEDCTLSYSGVPFSGGILAAGISKDTDPAKAPEIYNITFINCTITVNANSPNSQHFYWGNVGFLAGWVDNVGISGCFVDSDCSISLTATPNSVYSAAGMLVGSQYGTSNYMSNCGVEGSIDCYGMSAIEAGGLCGESQNITIQDCLSKVNITTISTGAFSYLGGIYGSVSNNGTVTVNCYNSGTLSGTATQKYGIGIGTTSTSCYWLDSCGGSGGGGESKTDTQLKQQATFADWDFATIWGIDEGVDYPYLGNLTIVTLPATEVWATGATIHGAMNNEGSVLTYAYMGFQWGPASDVSGETIHWLYSGTYGHGLHPIQATISGLLPDRTYYYRACLHIGAPPMTPNTYGSTLSFGGPTSIFGEGWEYVTAKKVEDDVSKLAVGRYYMDKSGNFVYESAKHRIA